MYYELVKALKEAGFQQFGDGFALVFHNQLPESDQTMSVISWRDFIHLTPTPDFLDAPTLEELIEACGGFTEFTLRGNTKMISGKWAAVLMRGDFPDTDWVHGTSPTEAVARLWLALHKKSVN